jgi:hypothetical protein
MAVGLAASCVSNQLFVALQRNLRRGDYLWELIASGQKEKDGPLTRR